MGGCFTTTTKDINMKNITDGKPQQSQEMADGGKTRNKAASEIPRNTDSLNSSQGSVGVSNRSRGDGSRGHEIGTPSMDNAYRQWEKPTKSPQHEPVGVHVEDAPGNSRSRGDGSDGKDLNEKIQRFKEKHKVGTDGKTSKYTHRRSLSATTSSSEDSPGGRSLFRKRSSTFSIGDSKDHSSRRRPTPNSTNMNNSGGRGGGGARPFGILSVLKEMNETGSFSRPNSNSMGQLEGLPVADKTTSELTYTTTTMSGLLPAQKTRSNSASPALSNTGTTSTTTMSSSSSSSSSSISESDSAGSSTTTTPTTTTVTISKNSTSKSSTPTPVVTPVQNVSTSTSSSTSSTNVTTIHQTSFPFTSPTTSTITTSSSFSVSNDGSAYTASSPSLSSSTTALLNPSPHSKPNSSTYEDSPTKGATEDRPLLIPSSSEYEPRKSLLSGNRKILAK